jgi:predicted O-methyltransferase YrrM
MRIQVIGSMGDELAMTAAVREAKRQRPDEMILLHGRWNPEIWINNPYLNIGNHEDGRLISVFSFYRTHQGSRTRLNFKLLDLDPTVIQDELPEFCWTPEELAAPIMVKTSKRKQEKDYRDLEELMAGWPAPVIAIDPGAGWPTRRWPEERFGELALVLSKLGYQVVQVGSGRQTLAGVTHNMVGRMKLRDLARFLGRCALYVGNDSGYFHVAAAVGCPHVTIYGPTRNTCGPYPGTVSVAPKSQCSPKCFEFCSRSIQGEGGKLEIKHCMEEIAVGEVLAAVKKAISSPRPPTRLVPTPTKAQVYEQLKDAAPRPPVLAQLPLLDRAPTLTRALTRTGKRRPTFELAVRLAKERGLKSMVETGTFRAWDAGGSTAVWAHLAAEIEASVVSIDIDKARLAEAALVLGPELAGRVTFMAGDSVEVLGALAGAGRKIDFLYLDSLDVGDGDTHQLHQLAEIKAAHPALSPGAVVVLDDDANDRGKGHLSRPWLESQGWRCVDRQQQSVFVRGG